VNNSEDLLVAHLHRSPHADALDHLVHGLLRGVVSEKLADVGRPLGHQHVHGQLVAQPVARPYPVRGVQLGAGVTVVMTPDAPRFVTPLTFEALSGRPVRTGTFAFIESSDPQHISLTERADLMLVAPATVCSMMSPMLVSDRPCAARTAFNCLIRTPASAVTVPAARSTERIAVSRSGRISTPSVAAGRIFGMSYRGDQEGVWALSESDGKELWFTAIAKKGGAGYNEGPRCTPTVDGDKLIIQMGGPAPQTIVTGVPRDERSAVGVYEKATNKHTLHAGASDRGETVLNDERSKTYDLRSISVCVCGGAPLPLEVKRDRLAKELAHLLHRLPHGDAARQVGDVGAVARRSLLDHHRVALQESARSPACRQICASVPGGTSTPG